MPKDIQHREFEEKDFTGAGVAAKPFHRGSTGNPEFDARITELVRDWRCGRHNELVEELIVTALQLGHDEISVGDMKLINRTLKELRGANTVFGPYQHRRKVTVYGSARTIPDKENFLAAMAFGRKMREAGYMIITGAGDGIMGAANLGAGRRDSFGLNINLPFEQGANETIVGDIKLVNFNYFFTRKLTFVKESDAVALFPGGFGTMDEAFELLTLIQTGKSTILPIVMVEAPGGKYWPAWKAFLEDHLLAEGLIAKEDFSLFKVTDNLDEAVDEIATFYKVFHSYRYVREKLSIRLKKELTPEALEAIQTEFGDLLKAGAFEQGRALRDELNEPALADMPRLVCTPNRRRFGRFRQLIDGLNRSETV